MKSDVCLFDYKTCWFLGYQGFWPRRFWILSCNFPFFCYSESVLRGFQLIYSLYEFYMKESTATAAIWHMTPFNKSPFWKSGFVKHKIFSCSKTSSKAFIHIFNHQATIWKKNYRYIYDVRCFWVLSLLICLSSYLVKYCWIL